MTLTPALSRRERGPIEVSAAMHRPESTVSIMDSQLNVQVGVSLEHPRIGPLSQWERVRVRGSSGFQIIAGKDSRILSSVIGYSRTRAPVAL